MNIKHKVTRMRAVVMHGRYWFVVLSLLIALVLVAGCAETAPTTPPPTTAPPAPPVEPVRIGLLGPFQGAGALYGEQVINQGAVLVFEEINALGGIKSLGGAKIEMVRGDTEGNPTKAVSEMERLIGEEKVVGIIGPITSDCGIAAQPVAERYKVSCLWTGKADSIYQQGWKYCFSPGSSTVDVGKGSVGYLDWLIKEYGVKADRIFITADDVTWAKDVVKSFDEELKKLGLYENVVDRITYDQKATDYTPIILRMKAANPDVWLGCGYFDPLTRFNQARIALGYKPPLTIGCVDGFSSKQILKNYPPEQVEEYFGAGYFGITDYEENFPLEAVTELRDKFRQKFGQDFVISYLAVSGSQVAYALVDAIEAAGSTDGEAIRAELLKLQYKPGDKHAVYPMWPYFGWDEQGREVGLATMLTQFQGGKRVILAPEQYAEAKPKFLFGD